MADVSFSKPRIPAYILNRDTYVRGHGLTAKSFFDGTTIRSIWEGSAEAISATQLPGIGPDRYPVTWARIRRLASRRSTSITSCSLSSTAGHENRWH